jgi:hexosaminidase
MMRLSPLALLGAAILLTTLTACGTPRMQTRRPTIVPRPVSLKLAQGPSFVLRAGTKIVVNDELSAAEGEKLATLLAPATGLALKVVRGAGAGPAATKAGPAATKAGPAATKAGGAIMLSLDAALAKALGDEGYRLEVTPTAVTIRAAKPAGLYYGIQTLRQLLPAEIFGSAVVPGVAWEVLPVTIEDYPRFRWRGLHLDVCRHFMPPAFVKRYIDLLALHKLNTFHWHLTEDQGWRIEIKKYPKLTSVGAWRKETLVGHYRHNVPHRFDGQRHGGFYTQDQVREIVAYAAARHVTIVPEIEMPGHAQAALAAYPEQGNTGKQIEVLTKWGISPHIFSARDKTILFLQDVLKEVLALFPGKYIHIGGDEAPKAQWKASDEMQALIRKKGLKDENELQSYFIKRMDSFLTQHGRRLVGWDEILQGGLAQGATVMSWRGMAGGIAAAKAGHDVVMAPTDYTYFDYYQADPKKEPLCIGELTPLKKVYGFEPVPKQLSAQQAKHVLGAQGQLWTEYIKTPARVEYMAYPRACALAEVVWTPTARKDYSDFQRRLEGHVARLSAMKVNYRKLDE